MRAIYIIVTQKQSGEIIFQYEKLNKATGIKD